MSRRNLPSICAVLFLAAIAAGLAAAWALGSALTAPALRAVGPPPPELGAIPVSFASGSGSEVRGWLVRGEPGRGAVVLAHSVRSSRLELVARASFLRRAGYSALLFDAQAHGESPGARITLGFRESHDARAAVDFLRSALPGERIGYIGVSQGGAAALLGADPLPVDALVVEAVYPTLREAIENRIRIRLGPLAPLLAPLLLVQMQLRLGIDPDAVAPIDGIRRVQAPLLVIAGERDRHTLLSESERLFEAAPAPKQLWVVPGAAHVDFHGFAPETYERLVLDFLERALRRGAPGAPPPDPRSN